MKTISTFAAAALFAISAAAPALAADGEALTLQERNTFAQQTQQHYQRADRPAAHRNATDAYAYEHVGSDTANHDLGIASQR